MLGSARPEGGWGGAEVSTIIPLGIDVGTTVGEAGLLDGPSVGLAAPNIEIETTGTELVIDGVLLNPTRSALLDVDATSKLVEVAHSNVELATRALSDETDRVNAGVDDNLPLVTTQATLAAAQSNLVESLYQYNLSKLALARAAGVLEQQYRMYLGR